MIWYIGKVQVLELERYKFTFVLYPLALLWP